MPRTRHRVHHSQVGAAFSSLVVRQANREIPDAPDVHALPTGTEMVKRQAKPDIVAQPVKFQSGITHRGAKAEQAWRYPNNAIVRAHAKVLGPSGIVYTDPKSDGEKPRRLQESNFFITINPNKKFAEVDAAGASGGVISAAAPTLPPPSRFSLSERRCSFCCCIFSCSGSFGLTSRALICASSTSGSRPARPSGSAGDITDYTLTPLLIRNLLLCDLYKQIYVTPKLVVHLRLILHQHCCL